MSVQSNSIFSPLTNQFRDSNSLFFDSQLSKKSITEACRALGHTFRDRTFSPAITVWMFIGQVLSSDQSCRDAIARLNVWRVARGKKPAATDSTSYVEARQRLPEQLLLKLARTSGADSVSHTRSNWQWKDRVVKTVDGSTVTMPDTMDNQREYPQSKSQKPGVGFPIMRIVVIFSLAVGAVLEIAIGKYSGKQVGETSLLRTLLNTILPGEIVLADCYYATYWLLAAAWQNEFDIVCKSHHRRKIDFRRGIKLGARSNCWLRKTAPSSLLDDGRRIQGGPRIHFCATPTIPSASTRVSHAHDRHRDYHVELDGLHCGRYCKLIQTTMAS